MIGSVDVTTVYVELFGIPRQRAGVPRIELNTVVPCIRLRDVLADLALRFPVLAEECFIDNQLRTGFVANLGGDKFVTDADTVIPHGQSLLIMSADAGG